MYKCVNTHADVYIESSLYPSKKIITYPHEDMCERGFLFLIENKHIALIPIDGLSILGNVNWMWNEHFRNLLKFINSNPHIKTTNES